MSEPARVDGPVAGLCDACGRPLRLDRIVRADVALVLRAASPPVCCPTCHQRYQPVRRRRR